MSDLQYHGVKSARLLRPWDSLGKTTAGGCHFLHQGIFLTQGSNPGLLHCRQIPYWLSYEGSHQLTIKSWNHFKVSHHYAHWLSLRPCSQHMARVGKLSIKSQIVFALVGATYGLYWMQPAGHNLLIPVLWLLYITSATSSPSTRIQAFADPPLCDKGNTINVRN